MAGKNFDISKFAATIKPVSESDTMREIPVDNIRDNPRNFYPQPDPATLNALADSIQANGLLEPPTVVPSGDGQTYRLISGHSRMAAVRKILSSGEESGRFEKVLCRVLPAMTEDQERSAVIEANRQRIKSGAILAEEAIRLTNAYIKRREAGEKLPGRIRDHVAKTLQVNATKVANVTAIKRGLKVPGIVRKWEEGDIPEATALEIARMDIEEQYRLLDWMIERGSIYSVRDVKMFHTIWTMFPHNCPESSGMCPNVGPMYDRFYTYGALNNCAGCCRSCNKRDTCKTVCQYFKPEKQPEPEPEVKRNPAVDNPRLDYRNMIPTFCQRVKELRIATGLSKKEFAESINEYPGTYSACENNSMCGSEKVAKLALCLGTTTDYLYGLTDDPKPPALLPEGQLMIAGWMPGSTTPAESGEFAVYVRLEKNLIPQFFRWDGSGWKMRTGTVPQVPVVWWMRLPPVPEKGENA